VTAVIRLIAPAPGSDATEDLRLQSRFARTFLHQPATARVTAATVDGSASGACVMVLGQSDKLSVGVAELGRDTAVSLAPCDLDNASREAGSTELLGSASLSARNIFLSGGYTLAAGAVMTASRYLATHTSPVADPYSRLEIPSFSGCTRTHTGCTGKEQKPFRQASVAVGSR